MKNFVLIMVSLIVGCSSYPNGQSVSKKMSYRGGDVFAWQNTFRQQVRESLDWDELAFKAIPSQNVSLKPISFNDDIHQELATFFVAFHSERDAIKQCQKNTKQLFYFESNFDFGLKFTDCDGIAEFPSQAMVLYDVRLKSFDQAQRQAYLILPKQKALESAEIPTFIYWHGHNSNRTQASFDAKSYHKAIGFNMAKLGFLTLVPDIRSFENGNKAHYQWMKKQDNNSSQVFASFVKDAYLWGQWLQRVDFVEMGMTIQPFLRGGVQVAGTSLGSQIALWVGALDHQYQVVTSVGGFYGFEVLFSKHHHVCQHVPKLMGLGNIMDVALLVWPRHLHIGMGMKDKFYNGFSSSAWDGLQDQLAKFGGTTCEGSPENMPEILLPTEGCQVSFERDASAGHELITNTKTFQILAGQKL